MGTLTREGRVSKIHSENKKSSSVAAYTLSPPEVEKLLAARYGDKLEPVDYVKLAQLNLKRQKLEQLQQ